jgi:molecular chaperone HscB
MNYFDLFNIPVALQVDQELLRKRYVELGGTDIDTGEPVTSAGNEETPTRMSKLENAYRVLQDPDETIRYVLQLKQLMGVDEEYKPDPQFLMEVGDINEELVELELDENQEQLMNVEQKANRVLLKMYEDVAPIIESYQENTTTEEELLQVKDFYHQKKYVEGILDRIRGIRNIAPSS